MVSRLRSLLFILPFIVIYSLQGQPKQDTYVLVVSMDGFRWDYPEKTALPHLKRIGESGVKADAIIPCFPSKTFPNHYSMATGLHPAQHGIVMNSFYDSDLELSYRISNRKAVMDPVFYGGEPIWVTAEKQGLTSASFYWVGSEAPVKGIQPTYWKPYQHDFPYAQRIDTVIAWLNLPEPQRPRLIMLYFDEPDGVGHAFGPNAPETFAVLRQMDSLIGMLYTRLQALPIFNNLNLIVTSDHGMGPISPDRTVVLSEILDPAWIIRAEGGNPSYNLQVREGFMDSVMSRIKAQPHLQVWKTNEAPERLHYRDHVRLLDLCVAADSAWSVHWQRKDSYAGAGTHGYDNANSDMHAIFYATGPAFKRGIRVPAFANVNLYLLISRLLGLEPAQTEGKLEVILPMLNEE